MMLFYDDDNDVDVDGEKLERRSKKKQSRGKKVFLSLPVRQDAGDEKTKLKRGEEEERNSSCICCARVSCRD